MKIVTILAEAGADIAVLNSMLNHAASGTRGGIVAVYQRATLVEPMRKAMALWNSLLVAAINPPAGSEAVLNLRRRRPHHDALMTQSDLRRHHRAL